MKTKFIIASLAFALLSTASPLRAADEVAAAPPPAPPSISVLTAQKKPIAEALNVTGSFAAGEMVLVSPLVEGLSVVGFTGEEGDQVKKGQVLATLDAASVDIQIMQTKASLARNDLAVDQATNQILQAQISVDKADNDLERTKKLRTSGVATQQVFDAVQAAAELAQAQLNGAKLMLAASKTDRLSIEAQMSSLLLNKSRAEIISPVDGYIATRTVQVGGIASGAKSPMYEIVAGGIVKLMAEVPESDLPRVREGQKASITINGFDKAIEGEVRLVSPQVNQQTRIGIVHIKVNTDKRIPIGAFGRATIALAAAEGVALPLTAVTFGDNGPTVQLVIDGKVVVRRVITGLVGTDTIEITDGVEAGEVFVARAGSFVRDGDAVTPVPMN